LSLSPFLFVSSNIISKEKKEEIKEKKTLFFLNVFHTIILPYLILS